MLRRIDLRIPDWYEEQVIGLAEAMSLSWFISPCLVLAEEAADTTVDEEDIQFSGVIVASLLFSTLEQDTEAITSRIKSWLDESQLPQDVLQTADYADNPDWMQVFKQYFQPIRVHEDILVLPAWIPPEQAETATYVLRIDPGMAFGTGTHETTKLCLRLLHDLPDAVRGKSFIDLGAGSGILAFFLVKKQAGPGVAIEIEGAAVENLRKNAVLNGVGTELEILCTDLFSYRPSSQFDLLVANLTSGILQEGLLVFSAWVKPGGTGIFSGIGSSNVANVRVALTDSGWDIMTELHEGEWHAISARRRSP